MYYSDIFYFLTIVLFFVSLIASGVVKSRFRKYAKDQTANGMTGAMAAERILRANGIYDVTIQQVSGTLSDNYNPTNNTLNLSTEVFGGNNVSAVAVAAHECGHAIQHAQAYPLLMLRKSLVPVCNIGSMGSYIAILLGILFSMSGLITLGAVLFSGIVLFNLITLPVEVDASRRALAEVERLNLLTDEELAGGKKVLFAAGMTYFISLVASIVQLLRLLSLANRSRRKAAHIPRIGYNYKNRQPLSAVSRTLTGSRGCLFSAWPEALRPGRSSVFDAWPCPARYRSRGWRESSYAGSCRSVRPCARSQSAPAAGFS